MRRALIAAILVVSWLCGPAFAQLPPEMAELKLVKSRHLDQVYLHPQADFKAYTKVMIDPAQVSFAKNWLKDMNNQRGISGSKISPEQAAKVAEEARKGFGDLFAAAFKAGGVEVVSSPGPDVLRLTPAVINLYVNAPAAGSSATRTYALSAGQASFVLAARDSISGALIGMALDKRETRSATGAPVMVDGVINRAEFETLFKRWAQIAVKGFNALREGPAPAPKK